MTALLSQQSTASFVDGHFESDPYPTYRAWRESGPVHWSSSFAGGAWIVSRHADVERVLRDPAYSARRTGGWVRHGRAARRELQPFQQLFARALLFLDGSDHGRIRRVLHEAFRPTALQAIVPIIERTADELLDALEGQPTFDFMQAVARPLPARVIGALMGFAHAPADDFTAWCEDLATYIGAMEPSPEQAQRAQRALLDMVRRLQPMLAQRRAAPGDDLVSRLLEAEVQGLVTAGPELIAQCAMLLFAGYETTRNLLGNGLHALLSHRDQWKRLHQQSEWLPGAVREVLRYESPVQYTGRRVAADTILHGRALRRGDLVLAMIGAANRDPAVYERPDELDIARQGRAPLSFGAGPHVCIGAALSSMETQAVFARLIRRWPGLELAEDRPSWNGNPVYRGLRSLHVRKAPTAASLRL